MTLPAVTLQVVLMVTAAFLPGSARAQENATVEAVRQGMECEERKAVLGGQLDCTYRVGEDLVFSVEAVGQADAAITFIQVRGFEGDFYASVGVLHGCVIVKPGLRGSPSFPEFAFVSPRTGQVYSTWQACAGTW